MVFLCSFSVLPTDECCLVPSSLFHITIRERVLGIVDRRIEIAVLHNFKFLRNVSVAWYIIDQPQHERMPSLEVCRSDWTEHASFEAFGNHLLHRSVVPA
jgi:hypothetical protein